MSDNDKRRSNTRFDVDARGVRAGWSKFDKVYDTNMQLPNDSDAVRNTMRFYIAGLIRDIESYGWNVNTTTGVVTNSKGKEVFDPSTVRTSDGFGGQSWSLFSNNGNWVDAYVPLYEQVYQRNISDDLSYLDNGGGIRDPWRRKNYHLMIMDSDGKPETIHINAVLKTHFSDFMLNDWYEQQKIVAGVKNVFLQDSDNEFKASVGDFKNWKASYVYVNESSPGEILTTSGDLTLTPASGQTAVTGNLSLGGTFTTTDLTVTNSLTVDGSVTFNGDIAVGDVSTDTANITANMFIGNDLDVDGNTTLDETTVAGTLTVNGNAVVDLLTFDAGLISTSAGDLTLTSNTGTVNITGTLVASADAVFPSLAVGDLTNDRVVVVGASGELEDDAKFTWNGTTLGVDGRIVADNIVIDGSAISSAAGGLTLTQTGGVISLATDTTVTGLLDVNGSATVDDVTINANKITTAAGNLILDSTGGTVNIQDNLDVDSQAILASCNIEDLTDGRVVFAGASGELTDSADFTFDNATSTLSVKNFAATDIDLGDITISGNTITSGVGDLNLVSTNGDVKVNDTFNVVNQATLSSVNVTDLTAGRVVFVGTNGELIDNNGFLYDSANTTLTIQGGDVVASDIQIGTNATNEIDTSTNDLRLDSATGETIIDDNLTVTGNLTVLGTESTVNSTVTEITDNTITLNSGETGAGVSLNTAGIEIDRGTLATASWVFDESKDKWYTAEGLEIDGPSIFDGTVVVNNTFTTTANAVLGNSSADTVTFNADVNSNIIPDANGTRSLGEAANRWDAQLDQLNVSGLATFTGNVDLGDATTDTVSFTSRVDTSINPSTTGANDLGTTALRWNNLNVVNVNASGNTDLGDANTDTVSFTARVDTSINPSTTSANDLGTTALRWNNLNVVNINASGNTDLGDANTDTVSFTARVDTSINPSTTGANDLGTTALRWNNLNVVNIDASGNTDLGNATSDTVSFVARVDTSINPSTTGANDLGTTALRWNNLNTVNINSSGNATIGDAATDTLTVNAAADFKSTVNVEGATTLKSTLKVDSTLEVDGATTLDGNVTIGDANTDTLTVNAAASLTDDLTVAGVTKLNGNTTIGNAASDTLTVNAETSIATVGANQIVFGDTAGKLDGNANLTWNGSALNVTGTTTVSGATTLNSSLAVAGAATLNGNVTLGDAAADAITVTGTATFAEDVQVNADITATGNVTAYSDARLKTDLTQINNATEKVAQLTGYTYTRTDTGARHTGLIAQDLQNVLPEAVVEQENGYLSVAYGNVVGLLVEALKESNTRISALEEEIKRLK